MEGVRGAKPPSEFFQIIQKRRNEIQRKLQYHIPNRFNDLTQSYRPGHARSKSYSMPSDPTSKLTITSLKLRQRSIWQPVQLFQTTIIQIFTYGPLLLSLSRSTFLDLQMCETPRFTRIHNFQNHTRAHCEPHPWSDQKG